ARGRGGDKWGGDGGKRSEQGRAGAELQPDDPGGCACAARSCHRRARPPVRASGRATGSRPMTAVSSRLISPRQLSRRADAMPGSAIREIMALAATRADVIHLEVGEPDFGTPEHIITAAFAAVRAGATKYTGNAGRPQLRERSAARVRERTRQSVGADQVIVTVGAIGALYTALMSVLDAGDEVLIPDPGWPNYEAIAVLAGPRPLRSPLTAHNGFAPD